MQEGISAREALTLLRALPGPEKSSLASRTEPREPFVNLNVGRRSPRVLRTRGDAPRRRLGILSLPSSRAWPPWSFHRWHLDMRARHTLRDPRSRRALLPRMSATTGWTEASPGRDRGLAPCKEPGGGLDRQQEPGGSLNRQQDSAIRALRSPYDRQRGTGCLQQPAPSYQPLGPAACAPGPARVRHGRKP